MSRRKTKPAAERDGPPEGGRHDRRVTAAGRNGAAERGRDDRLVAAAVAAALVGLNLIVYSAVRTFQLVNWDDTSYIIDNPNVLAGLSWANVRWALTTGHSPYWHPVTWLSHLLDVTLFGADAGGYHLTNLIIHIANTLLLFVVLRFMTADPVRRSASRGRVWRCAFVAALFAVHPLHVESVAWVAERKDVLSGFFAILTMGAYAAYVRRPALSRYLTVFALFALALMSKPMMVTLPFALLLLDVWPLARAPLTPAAAGQWRRLVVEKLPLVALAVATGVATFVVQRDVGAVAGLDVLPLRLRVENALVSYVLYLWKIVWPDRLAAFYAYHVHPAWAVFASALALVVVTALAFRDRERHPYLLVGWLWYLITLSPVIGLAQAGEQAMADRFVYVPILGPLIVVAWGVPDLLPRLKGRVLAVASIAVLAILTVTARAQVATWSDSVALWRHASSLFPESYLPHEYLGQALRERGELEDAKAEYQRALALTPPVWPKYAAVLHNSLGLILTRQVAPAEALAHFQQAAALDPGFAEARSNLGNALAAEGRYGDAIEHYRAAVTLKADFTEALVGLGGALLGAGRAAEAIDPYQHALRIDPKLAQAHNGLGAAYATTGDEARAMAQYEEALTLKPDLPTAHFNLALLLIKQNRVDEARRHLRTAVTIDPGYQAAQQALKLIG